MKICKKCGAKYPDIEEICSIDGQKLSPLPDFLMGRTQSSSSHSGDSFIGKQIEKYKIIRQIGEGGMGVVYEAEHIHIGKKVALKILREDFTKKQDVVERFKQEARSASIIGHPNIIDVTDFGYTHDGRVFFIMEYLDGEDLATVLETEHSLPYKRVITIAKQVSSALEAAHQKGIIHRDMKPENIFLVHPGTKDEKVKILDFGIAKMSILDQEGRKLTKTGVIFGTPEYMSPEQAAGKQIDKRVDIYSLGIIMYEMLTGKVPFTGDSFMQILSKHIFEPIPPIRSVSPNINIPTSLERIIQRCLEKDPDKRISSAGELTSLLESVENEEESTVSVEIKLEEKENQKQSYLEFISEPVPLVIKKKKKKFKIAALVISVLIVLSGVALYFQLNGAPALFKKHNTGTGARLPKIKKELPEKLNNIIIQSNEKISTSSEQSDSPTTEEVTLRIETIPAGAIVDIEGKGNICPATPCNFSASKGQEIELVLKRGKFFQRHRLTPVDNPTIVRIKMGQATKKAKPQAVETPSTKPIDKKIKNIDSGDIKIPEIFKDK